MILEILWVDYKKLGRLIVELYSPIMHTICILLDYALIANTLIRVLIRKGALCTFYYSVNSIKA